MTKAYSYIRFSTPDQAAGDSLRRQTQAAQEYAARNGLELDDKLSFRDLGVSAFHGKNAAEGALSAFLQAVEDGLVEAGSYLIVESLDRLSRERARRALRTLEEIVDAGVVVVTLFDGREYDAETLDKDPMALIMAILTFARANEESATKSRRNRASWSNKRQKAAETPMTAKGPGWLKLVEGKWTVDEERAGIVRDVFDMARAGRGQEAIAQTLNKAGIPSFGGGKHWHKSYIKRLLENPAVVGTFVPHTLQHTDGKTIRKPQDPVTGYFPAIVKEEVYRAVEAMRQPGRRQPGVRSKPVHVLAGIATCGLCGAAMTRVVKGHRSKPKLVCSRAKIGAGCQYISVDVEAVEEPMVREIDMIVGTAPTGDEAMDEAVTRNEDALWVVGEQVENLMETLSRTKTAAARAAMTAKLDELMAEQEKLKSEQRELSAKIAETTAGMVEKRLEGLHRQAKAGDKVAMNAFLRQLVKSVEVNPKTGFMELQWKHGASTSVMFDWPKDEPASPRETPLEIK